MPSATHFALAMAGAHRRAEYQATATANVTIPPLPKRRKLGVGVYVKTASIEFSRVVVTQEGDLVKTQDTHG
jgi:hypothetical protein